MTRSTSPSKPPVGPFLGIDVAKATVTLYDGETGRCRTIDNHPDALKAALAPLKGRRLAVCEATGGYEAIVLTVALEIGLPIHRADAAKVKAFIRSYGGLAKTDPIDAAWLARFAAERHPSLVRWTPPDPDRLALADLVRLRQDNLAIRVQTENRCQAPGGATIKTFLENHLAFLSQQIDQIERKISEIIANSPTLAKAHATLCAIKGIGRITATLLLAILPELGSLSPKQAAALAGLAPHPVASGQKNQRSSSRGGRASLKPALFLAALAAVRHNPELNAFYQRLCNAGKPKLLAINAASRKLVVFANAALRDANKNIKAQTQPSFLT